MDSKSFDELKKMYDDLCEERDNIVKKIEENNLVIREADSHKKSILSRDNEDFKVFSPRTVESVYREELDKLDREKDSFQKQNNQLYHERNKLNSMIELLDRVINDDNDTQNNLNILNIQENERKRIARDLHDTSLQNLAFLVHKIELATMFIDQDPTRAKLELAVVSKNLRETIDDIRNTIYDLRPMEFDDLGLKAAFERLIFQLNQENPIELDLEIENVICENDLILVTIYRIVQELLINVYKHSEADKLTFHCRQTGQSCIIDIIDNGKGFERDDVLNKKDKHFGLSMMRERVHLLGGECDIVSAMDSGTKIRIVVPLR